MDFDKKNYYEVLEIPSTASATDIKMAYQRMKNSYSADSVALYSLISADDCNKMIEMIEEAYSILGNPDKRVTYDQARGFNPNGLQEKKIEVNHTFKQSFVLNPMEETMEKASRFEEKPQYQNQQAENTFEPKVTQKENVAVSKVAALKKFSLDFIVDHALEQEIDNLNEFSGAWLKKIREYKNVSIERMADLTRVSKTYLKAVEDEDLDKLPAEVYVRGFVYQIAKCLKLNADHVAVSYISRLKKLKKK
jgi:curved DNA-binding protein CbpA